MRALHLPGVPQGQPIPFRFPDAPASPKNLQYTGTDYPEPQTPSSASEHTYVIRVLFTALTRGELTWEEILEPSRFHVHGGAIPGHDVVGIIDKVLTSSTAQSHPKFAPGDKVWALLDFDRDGAAAEYTVAYESELSLAPKNPGTSDISTARWDSQLATLPLSGLTAYQTLFTHGSLPMHTSASPSSTLPPRRVLILGAAGSVGLPTVQLAKASGFTVVATTSASSAPLVTFLLDPEVDTLIDYTSADYTSTASSFASQNLPPVDLIVDCIGGTTLSSLLLTTTPPLNSIIQAGSKIITLVAPIKVLGPDVASQIMANCTRSGVEAEFFVVKPSGPELDVLGRWVEEGRLRGHIHGDKVFPLLDGREAMTVVEARDRKGGGKVVLRIGQDGAD